MTSISSVSSAWSSAGVSRASGPPRLTERLLNKFDADSSGGVDGTELQSLLDDVAKKTGVTSSTSASDLLTQYDSDGNGSLSRTELGQTLQSVLPPPPSTLAFAQSRGAEGSDSTTTTGATGRAGDDLFGKVDSNGDSTVSADELQALLEKMSGGTASQTGASSEALFSQLDTDGNGSLSQSEFDAGRPQGSPGEQASGGTRGLQQAGGMPPPPPGGMGGPGGPRGAESSESSSASSSSTTYDPLDTNEDGTVSLEERLAGALNSANSSTSGANEVMQSLFKAIDSDGDNSISSTESKAFLDQLASELGINNTSNSSSASAGSSDSGTNDGSSQAGGQRLDLAQLAQLARRQYEATAANWAGSSSRLSAVA